MSDRADRPSSARKFNGFSEITSFIWSVADLLRGDYKQADRERTRQGAGQPNLNTGIVRSTPIPLPPLDEQKKIVAFLVESLNDSKRQEEAVGLQLELLREYRQALISTAVTGKFDVTGESA
jgi:type I restriction enzyme S subunit